MASALSNATHTDVFQSKLHPLVDYMLGGYMMIVAFLSVSLNGLVLLTVTLRKRSMSALDVYVCSLALGELFHALFVHPQIMASTFMHRWILDATGCHVYACMVVFFGTSDISILIAICVTRYIKICSRTGAGRYVTLRSVTLSLLPIYGNSFLWAVSPLLGWAQYAPEPFGLACNLDWPNSPHSYLASILSTCYGLPVVLLLVCYGRITMKVCQTSKNMKFVKTSLDIYTLKMAGLMCVTFFISWTPYAIVSLLHLARCHVPQFFAVSAPFFAKSSTIYNPIVYFMTVKRFRDDITDVCHRFVMKKKQSHEHSLVKMVPHTPLVKTFSSKSTDSLETKETRV